ncbi:hypothetical protein [Streptomyces sp. NPDC058964]|uniref:hypothetical protein n=1 Tax=Streptomyces sp. NPDC058964 TaxID=3346681 RepID=UPI0036A491F0
MGYRRRRTLIPSTLELFRAMGVKAWARDGSVRHNGPDDIRADIKANLERVRRIGVRGTALFFGAVLLTAMERGCFTKEDIDDLDPMGKGNAGYILEKLRENNDER